MSRVFIACFFFFVIFTRPVFTENTVFHWHLETGFSLLIGKDQRFPIEPQAAETVQTGFLFSIGEYLGLNTSFGVFHVHPTNLANGIGYRGYEDMFILLSFQAHTPPLLQNSIPIIRLGIESGAEMHFARYSLTHLYFFFIGVLVEPFISIATPRADRWSFRFSLPVRLLCRLDTKFSVVPGIAVGFTYRPSFSPFLQ